MFLKLAAQHFHVFGKCKSSLGARHWTDENLDHLTGLDSLESLTLHESAVTGAGLVKLRELAMLGCLTVSGGEIVDSSLSLPQALPFGFQGATLQRDDMADLSKFPKLTALEFSQCSLGPGTLALVVGGGGSA